jgi:large subunit ribosomal protein L35
MPKMKTKSSAKKRFTLTGSGRIRRRHANHRHNLSKQPKKRKRGQLGSSILRDCDAQLVRGWMPYL